ncbi:hypothetical protein [Glycomyces sp. NPDC048151]|uniref:hypothetical protein n=1 Tax=Glycomyces sp. NPDC048151 TaxID=3364002 RepID=UPI003724709D
MGRLFRRVVRTARRPRRGTGATTVRSAGGKQYRVVAVDEAKDTEFADPPRKWGRVGVMAGAWAIALALGAWVAPGFAASGNPENQDPRDEAATDADGAALRYLRYGSNEDLDRAESALCEDASPEVAPEDLDAIRQAYAEEFGGITDIDVNAGDPVPSTEGISIAGTVSYIAQGNRRQEDFLVTVQETNGTYCVSNATQAEEAGPTEPEATGEPVDPKEIARGLMQAVVLHQDPAAAAEFQCAPASYSGITPEELDAAITEWASTNGETDGAIDSTKSAETSESSVTAFDIQITLAGDLNVESFVFTVGVQGDCVSSIDGGEELMEPAGN